MRGMGTVKSRTGDKARVQVKLATGSAGCAGKSHCYTSGREEHEITVLNDYGAEVGDRIVFEADPGKVALSSLLVWVLPILAMIAGYLAGERVGGGFIPIAAAFLFLGLSFFLLRVIDRAVSGGRTFYPQIIAILDPSDDGSALCGD